MDRQALNQLPEPAWIVDANGEVLHRNNAAIAFESASSLGIFTRLSSVDFQLLTTVSEVIASQDPIRMMPIGGILTAGLISIYPQDGTNAFILYMPMEDSTISSVSAKSSPVSKQIRFNDIFLSFFELSPIGLAIADREGTLLYANTALADIVGVVPEDLIGLPASTFVKPSTWSEFQTELRNRINVNDFEFSLPDVPCFRSNGEPFLAELKLTRLWADAKLYYLIHLIDRSETNSLLQHARETEATYHQFFHNSPVAFVLWDHTGAIYDLNPAAKHLFFEDEGAEPFKTMQELMFNHADPNDFLPDLGAILGGEWFQNVNWHFLTPLHELEIDSTFLPHYSAQGKIVGGIMISRDITTMNRSLRDWRRRNQQLAQLLDSVSKLTSLNELQKLFDAAVDELSRLGMFQFVVGFLFPATYQNRAVSIIHSAASKSDVSLLKERIHETLLTDMFELEFESVLQPRFTFGNCFLFTPDALTPDYPVMSMLSQFPSCFQSDVEVEYHELLIVPIKDRANQNIGAIVLSQPLRKNEPLTVEQAHIFELFSRVVGSQLDLLRLVRQTISAEQRYHSLIDQLGEGVLVTDPEDTILIVNPAATLLLGYSTEELLGRNALSLFPETQHTIIAKANEARRNKIASTYETVIIRSDGTLRTVMLTATPLLDERQEFVGSLGLLTDISERRSNEIALRQAYEELAANNRFANLLASRISAANIEQKAMQLMDEQMQNRQTVADNATSEVQFASLLATQISTESLEEEALQLILETVAAEHGAVLLFEPEQNNIRVASVRSLIEPPLEQSLIEQLSSPFHEFVVTHASISHCFNIDNCRGMPASTIELLKSVGIGSFGIYPLNARHSMLGLLFVAHSNRDAFSQSLQLLLNSFTEQLSLALDNTRLLKALLKASSNWAITFDAMPDPIFVVGSNGTIRRMNKTANAICGGQVRDNVGRRLDDALGEFGYYLNNLPDSVTELEETQTINDRERTFSITIVPLPSTDRLIILRDVTEGRFLQEQMFEAQRRELIVRFAGGVAHDFNNLLVGIMGTADLLSKRIDGDKQQHDMLKVILDSSKRAAELVKQLLAYARGGAMQVLLIDINTIVIEVQKLLRVTMHPDISIRLNLAEKLPSIAIDETQLQQIIMNLGINAGEALSSKGTITFETGSGVETLGQNPLAFDTIPVWLKVYDDGSGFPAKILDHPGEPFNSTKGTGRGLGLAAVFGIVARHNGKITLSNVPGAGACVTIVFPAVEEETSQFLEEFAPTPPKRYEAPIEIVEPPTETKRVLIVDDEAMVRGLTRDVLETIGCEVNEAENGEIGLELLREQSYDLVLLDIVMPKMSGIDVYHLLREFNTDVPVLFVSGYDESEMVVRLSDPKLGFLQKPFMINDFIERVSRHFNV